MGRGRGLPGQRGGLSLPRKVAGYALALLLAPLLTLVLANLRQQLNLTSDMLVFLIGVVAVALVGGLVPAVIAAVAGSLFLNYYFTPPFHTFNISERTTPSRWSSSSSWAGGEHDRGRRGQAVQAGGAGQRRVRAAGHHRGQRPARRAALQAVVDRVREAFGMQTVTLLERAAGRTTRAGAGVAAVATSGEPRLPGRRTPTCRCR